MSAATNSKGKLDTGVLAALAAVYLIWSSTYFVIHIVVEHMPPLLTAGLRFVIAGLILLVLARGRGLAFPDRAAWIRALPIGLLLFVCGNGFVSIASSHISSGVIAVVCGMMPIWGALLGPFFGTKTTPREWLGLIVGFLGVAVLAFGDALRADFLSTVLLLLAPLGWALGSLLVKKANLGEGMMGAATQTLSGGVLLTIVGAFRGESITFPVPTTAVAALAYLIFFGSVIGFTAYNHLLLHARPALAMSYAYVNPVLAVLLGAWLGNESITMTTLAALALIVLAVLAIVTKPRPTPSMNTSREGNQ